MEEGAHKGKNSQSCEGHKVALLLHPGCRSLRGLKWLQSHRWKEPGSLNVACRRAAWQPDTPNSQLEIDAKDYRMR